MNTSAIVGTVLGGAALAYAVYSLFKGTRSSDIVQSEDGTAFYGDEQEPNTSFGSNTYGTMGGKRKKTKKSKHGKKKRTHKK